VNAGEAAFALGDQAKVETVLDILQNLPGPAVAGAAGARRPLQRARAGERGEADVAERRFKRAAGLFREIACPFYLAVTQLEHGEWLAGQGRASESEPLLAESREVFEGLRARPWVERCDAVIAPVARIAAGTD
jgi:hypothetical protein